MKTVIEMAREAGIDAEKDTLCRNEGWVEPLEHFATLVAKHTLANIDPSSFMSWQEGYAAGAAAERNRVWTQSDWTEYEHDIAAAEREACAKHAEDFLTKGRSPLGRAVGDAIRARGST